MERVAIPIWQGRISPVLDTAERLWVCDLDSGSAPQSQTVELRTVDIRHRTELIRSLGVCTLLCGAVSRPMHDLLVHAGVTVRPWLTGAVEEVLAAYSQGRLDRDCFHLPGCGQRRHRCRSMGKRGGREKGRK